MEELAERITQYQEGLISNGEILQYLTLAVLEVGAQVRKEETAEADARFNAARLK